MKLNKKHKRIFLKKKTVINEIFKNLRVYNYKIIL